MKTRFGALVGVFCIALLIVSGAYAGKPTDKPDKPGKPPRPGNIAVECIEFTGDHVGECGGWHGSCRLLSECRSIPGV